MASAIHGIILIFAITIVFIAIYFLIKFVRARHAGCPGDYIALGDLVKDVLRVGEKDKITYDFMFDQTIYEQIKDAKSMCIEGNSYDIIKITPPLPWLLKIQNLPIVVNVGGGAEPTSKKGETAFFYN